MPGDGGMRRLRRDTSKEVAMRNWTKRILDAGGLRVVVTTQHVIIFVQSFVVGVANFKERVVLACVLSCQEVAAILQVKYGFKLDIFHPKLVTPPQYALPDLLTGAEKKKVIYQFSGGSIDYSKGSRELEFNEAERVSDMLSMPYRQHVMDEKLDRILWRLSEGWLARVVKWLRCISGYLWRGR